MRSSTLRLILTALCAVALAACSPKSNRNVGGAGGGGGGGAAGAGAGAGGQGDQAYDNSSFPDCNGDSITDMSFRTNPVVPDSIVSGVKAWIDEGASND